MYKCILLKYTDCVLILLNNGLLLILIHRLCNCNKKSIVIFPAGESPNRRAKV